MSDTAEPLDQSSRLVLAPYFQGNLAQSTLELVDFFELDSEADVPVTRFRLCSSLGQCEFPVVPGKYRTALFLLYCASVAQQTRFQLNSGMSCLVRPYYGDDLVADAMKPETQHRALRILLGEGACASLELKDGWQLPPAAIKTLESVIRWGWSRYEEIQPGAAEPFLRMALDRFSLAIERHEFRIIRDGGDAWVSDAWVSRVLTLMGKLGRPPA